MSQPFPKPETRQALRDALPENDQASAMPTMDAAFTYVPPSHARALHYDNTLVEGIRGAGKSFWWAALKSEAHRHFVAAAFPEARLDQRVAIAQGFGAGVSPDWPDKDTLQHLVASGLASRHIWRAVIAVHVQFPEPFPQQGAWYDKVLWVQDHPEKYAQLLVAQDEGFATQGTRQVIVFDALDRLADDWPHIRPLARALLQVSLELRDSRCIRAKVFVRPDMLEDRDILAFPDASKLLSRKVALVRQREDLYALLFPCLGNASAAGDVFRGHCRTSFQLQWDRAPHSQAWVVPHALRHAEATQHMVFHAIAGSAMASGPSGHKRGFPTLGCQIIYSMAETKSVHAVFVPRYGMRRQWNQQRVGRTRSTTKRFRRGSNKPRASE